MNRFEQRMYKRLQNPAIAAGFREQAAERELLRHLEEARKQLRISKEELATRMGRHSEAASRLLNATDASPTLETLVEILMALGMTADITLRLATDGEDPIRVTMVL
jgi:transcriptional regulator with XRE-family HTH domain